MSGTGEDFASFGDFSSGAVDLQENGGGSSEAGSNYLNWEAGKGTDASAGADFGDFSSFGADAGGDAAFDFSGADFDAPTGASGSDLTLSAEDLAASGLDMEWAQKIGLDASAPAVGGEAPAASGSFSTGDDFSFGTADSTSFDASPGAGGAPGGVEGGENVTTSDSGGFGDFSGLTAGAGEGNGSFTLEGTPSAPVSQEESPQSVPPSSDLGGGDSAPLGGAAEAFASFGSFSSDPPAASGDDSFSAFDSAVPNGGGDEAFASFGAMESTTPAASADISFDSPAGASGSDSDAFASFGAETTPASSGVELPTASTATTPGAATDDWGAFDTPSSDAAKAATSVEQNTESKEAAAGAEDAFASFDTPAPASADGFGDFDAPAPVNSTDSGGFDADFGAFSATAPAEVSASVTDADADAAADGFGDFGAFGQDTSFSAADDGFATFESAPATDAGADGFGSFGEPAAGGDDGFASFSEPASGGDDWGFPEAEAPAAVAPTGTSLFSAAGSMNLVEMDDISFRREVASALGSIFGATAKTAGGTDAAPPPSLRTLLTTGPDGSSRCKRCKSVTFPTSHICLTCGDIIVQHSLQDQWTDNHATKHKFAQVMYIPEAKASHHNPLQPSAPGQVLPTAVALQEASKLAPPLSPMRGDEPPVLVATSLDPSEPSISLLPITVPETPPEPTTSTPVKLTDFDLSVFGEIAPAKQTASNATSSDFDSFLLGFDSASMSTQDSEMASIASINEKIEQQSRKKKQSSRRGASEDTMEAELDSSQPTDSKKLLEIMNKIPDLTFMSSKTLVVPASNYSFALSSNAGTR